MENTVQQKFKPFGKRDQIGYLFGDLGNDFTFHLCAGFLMVFYTNVLGVSGTTVGTLFLVSRIVDAFTDMGMGRILDTAKPHPEGRFRIWIKRIAPFVSLAGALCFVYVVQDWPYWAKLVYMYVTYLFWGSFMYTAINIPYGSMASVMSTDPDERASLSVYRSMGANLAMIGISFIVPQIIYTKIDGVQTLVPQRMTMVAIVFAVLAYVCYQVCYRLVVERVQIEHVEQESRTIGEEMKLIAKGLKENKALQTLVLAALMLILTQMLQSAVNAYLFIDYFASNTGLSIAGALASIGGLALSPFATNLVRRYGKKESATAAMIWSSGLFFGIYLLKGTIGSSVWMFLVCMFVANLGIGYFNLVIWSFLTDVIDNHEVETGRREDGTIYAVYSFSRKLGQALAGFMGGLTLTLINYDVDAAAEGMMQTDAVRNSLYSFYTLSSAIGFLVVAVVLKFLYPLSKGIVDKNAKILNKRREAQAD